MNRDGRPRLENTELREYWRRMKRRQKLRQEKEKPTLELDGPKELLQIAAPA